MNSITISGTPGSGKSTVGKLLEEKTNLRYVYSGLIFREISKKYNMSLEKFGRYNEEHKEVDEKIDNYQLEILKKDNIILEGRIAGWIAHRNNIPAIKIWIDADLETRAERIVKREKGILEKRKQEILTREKSEATRYEKYYDIAIDCNQKTVEEIINEIIATMNRK